jgi:hydroxyethylthiazole kinase-like uncharacterized protein yjeF
MKIFSAAQIYEADNVTAKKQGISSVELMERAGLAIFNWMHLRMQGAQVKINIFCGIGNNGGDGLVLGRHLIQHGYNVEIFIVNYSTKRSKNFLLNYDRIKEATKSWPSLLNEGDNFPALNKDDIIVDALFGIGLNRPPNAWVIGLMQHINQSQAYIASIDIPSGLFVDQLPTNLDAVIKAGYTLSFQAPKLVFFLPETAVFTEQWEVIDIGLDQAYLMETEVESQLIGKNEILPIYKPREKFSHKGSFGHCLIVGGSYGKIGAVQLAARSALKVGSGLLTSFLPKCGYLPLQTALPEAMVVTDDNENFITNINPQISPTAIGIGMGMGVEKDTILAFEAFLKINEAPLVIDADALNILAIDKALLKLLPTGTVLTPHPKELERLIGKWKNDFDKIKKAKKFATKYQLVLLIKGANSITVFENKLYVNTTGNPGLATAGSGDVLTGMITGLIAQGYNPLEASLMGVYLHGKAADIAVENLSYQALLASDVIDYIGDAYLDLFKQAEPAVVEEEGENEAQEEGGSN